MLMRIQLFDNSVMIGRARRDISRDFAGSREKHGRFIRRDRAVQCIAVLLVELVHSLVQPPPPPSLPPSQQRHHCGWPRLLSVCSFAVAAVQRSDTHADDASECLVMSLSGHTGCCVDGASDLSPTQ